MTSNYKNKKYHFWFPNLFDFKGGIQVYLQDFLRGLRGFNFDNNRIKIFDKLDKGYSIKPFDHQEFSFVFSGSIPKFLRTYHFATNILLSGLFEKPKLIICGHLNFAPIALFLNKLTGIPYWIFVYGVDAWNIEDKGKKESLQKAEKIISISGYTTDRLIKEEQLDPSRIFFLPVTFEVNRFQITPKPQHLLQRYELKPDQPTILTVSRLDSNDQYKGYDQIIRALPKIKKEVPDVHYLLVGKGSDRARIEQLIKNLHLENSVTLTGFVPDDEIADHYNLCDVFAMPSKGEGFGIVYLEALACGKPTLGGNQDGAIDALCHGELGVLIDPDNVTEIEQALIEILQGTYPHPILYKPEVLRQKVIDIYGFETFKERVAELFQQAELRAK